MIIQDHTTKEYLLAQSKLSSGKFNGAYFYSKEIIESFIPNIKTDYNWQTINHQEAPEHCIIFVHSNNALNRYDYLLKYKDIILVCSTHNSMNELKKKGHKKVIYVPLSIDTKYLDKFKNNNKNGVIAVGNQWAFTPATKSLFRSKGIIHYHDIPRDKLLTLISKAKTVYAIGRTAMESIYLGAEVIQPDKEYPVEKYDKYYTQEESISILQSEIDRITHPLKTVVCIATYKGREETLKRTIKSLVGQCDVIRIYNNEERPVNLTDNGKFFFLQEYKEPVYYFTCDDDIIYPPTYIEDLKKDIERTGTIVTHHGRTLLGFNRSYYKGHKYYRFDATNNNEGIISVAGTGVTGFRTDYFNPTEIWKSKDLRMSDLVFSNEASKQGKKITVLRHRKDYFKYQNIPNHLTIHGMEYRKEQRQIEIANEIFGRKK